MATTVKPKRQFRVVNKGKGKLDITKANLHEVVGNTEDEKTPEGPGIVTNKITDYRSDYDSGYIYSGFHYNEIIVIKRVIDNNEEIAQGLTNLETDWLNRLNLTYI